MRGPYAIFSAQEIEVINAIAVKAHRAMPKDIPTTQEVVIANIIDKCESAMASDPRFREPHE